MGELIRFCAFHDCVYFRREKTGQILPQPCPRCKRRTTWLLEPLPVSVSKELDDRAFLRSLHITPEW